MYRVSVSRGDWRRVGSEIGVENGIFSLFFSFSSSYFILARIVGSLVGW